MTDSEESSLSAQLLVTQTQHRELDERIAQLHDAMYVDQLQLQRLKREKLRLKEAIERIKCRLIPDMDA